MNDLAEILRSASTWRERGEAVALATVIETWGSSPRPVGSMMAVSETSQVAGSVSGGCVEGAVIKSAREAMQSGQPLRLAFEVSDESAFAVGLACGGGMQVFVEPLGFTPETLAELRGAQAERRHVTLATRLADGSQRWINPEGPSRVAEIGGEEWFLHDFPPAPRLLLVGAGHLAQVLAQHALLLGMAVSIIDPRPLFASPSRFPDCELIISWPGKALERIRIDQESAVVVVSHDSKFDDPALVAALRSPAFYIGALGSRKNQAARRSRLAEFGFENHELDRIHGPVGLPIGAVGADEIAISILAEVIKVRREGKG